MGPRGKRHALWALAPAPSAVASAPGGVLGFDFGDDAEPFADATNAARGTAAVPRGDAKGSEKKEAPREKTGGGANDRASRDARASLAAAFSAATIAERPRVRARVVWAEPRGFAPEPTACAFEAHDDDGERRLVVLGADATLRGYGTTAGGIDDADARARGREASRSGRSRASAPPPSDDGV